MKIGKIQFNKGASPTQNSKISALPQGEGTYSPCFNGLHISPKTLKETHFTERELLRYYDIKEASDKFEVLCKAGKKKYKFRHFEVQISELGKIARNSFCIGALAGITSALLPEAIISSFAMPNLPLVVSHIGIGIFAGSLYGFIDSLRQSYKKIPELNIQIGQDIDIKDNDIDNAKLKGHKSETEIALRKVGAEGHIQFRPYDGAIDNVRSNIAVEEEKDFKEVLSYFDTDDLFDAKNYLKLLQKLKEKCPHDKHLFEHKIDKMGNTMLTAFFDVPLTNKNSRIYDEIIDILSKEPNLDFNQKGYMGVSILEKVLLAENEKALDLVSKYTILNYTPELNDIYVNMQNDDFKKKVKKLNFKYKDLENALRAKSGKALDKILPFIEESELLDRTALQSQTEWIMDELVQDRDFEVFMCKNYPQLIYDTPTGKIWREGRKR